MKYHHHIFILSTILILVSIIGEYYRTQTLKEGMGLDFLWFPICIIIGLLDFMIGLIEIIAWIAECIPSIPYIFIWNVTGFMCGLNGIFNLPKCFLWYLLEFIGWVLYLPFRFLFWLVDVIVYAVFKKDGLVKAEHQFWCILEDLDKIIHKISGAHIIHYPDSVIEKCYTCKMPPFPKLPSFPNDALDKMMSAFNC
jgi:hypothetical protein